MIKRKFSKTSIILKILWPWLSAKFSIALYVLTNLLHVKNSHILSEIYFIFLKRCPRTNLWPWLSAKFTIVFYVFINLLLVKNSHILAEIYFIFLKERPRPNSKVFQYQIWASQKKKKDRKSSYHVRQISVKTKNNFHYVKQVNVWDNRKCLQDIKTSNYFCQKKVCLR